MSKLAKLKSWSKLAVPLVVAGLIFSSISFAGGNGYNRQADTVRIREKVVEYGEPIKVIGVPQNQIQTDYHWQADTAPCLTQADIQKIAEIVADILEKRLSQPAAGDNGANNKPQPNDIEKKFLDIVTQKCAACHGVSDHAGDLDFVKDGQLVLTDLLGKLPPSDIAWLMYDEGFHATMPPQGKPPLTDDEVQVFQQYAAYLTRQERGKK